MRLTSSLNTSIVTLYPFTLPFVASNDALAAQSAASAVITPKPLRFNLGTAYKIPVVICEKGSATMCFMFCLELERMFFKKSRFGTDCVTMLLSFLNPTCVWEKTEF